MKFRILSTCLIITSSVPAYTLHEWGTFTSISGSDGQLLAGLEREEERLPPFVHSLEGMQNHGPFRYRSKGFYMMRPLKNVTIIMETPVIYFYSEQAFEAKVEVGFNGGSINQWYPQRSGGESVPPLPKKIIPLMMNATENDRKENFIKRGGLDFSSKREGSIEWKIEVLDPEASRGLSFKQGETLNWLRPRNPKANILKVGEQYEDYLFYRGVGNFELPVNFRVDAKETLHIENTGEEIVPFLFVQDVTPDRKVRFYTIDAGLEKGTTKTIAEADFTNEEKWQRPVYEAMTKGLLKSGLTPEETHGMVQTWWHSYFEQPGLRVFWIVPQAKTNAILPLKVTPAPEESVRVLVGRSEILRPRFEQELLANYAMRSDKKKSALWNNNISNRYGKAYQQRIKQLSEDKVTSVK